MHPPRRKEPSGEPHGLFDRSIDWLLVHCPFSTVTILLAIVLAPAVGPVPQPALIAIPVVVADIGVNLLRHRLRQRPHRV